MQGRGSGGMAVRVAATAALLAVVAVTEGCTVLSAQVLLLGIFHRRGYRSSVVGPSGLGQQLLLPCCHALTSDPLGRGVSRTHHISTPPVLHCQ